MCVIWPSYTIKKKNHVLDFVCASLSRSHARDIEVRRILSLSLRYLHPKNLIGLDMSGMAMLAKEVWIELH